MTWTLRLQRSEVGSARLGGGKTIAPTGKTFKQTMVTIGHWRNGLEIEEWLMWDNQSFIEQIGLAP
jgi:hypothetical protein